MINDSINFLGISFSAFEWAAIILSLKVALNAVLWSLPFGILTAWILARYSFYGKTLLDSLIHLPLVLPPVVIGYMLLISMGKKGIIGRYLYEWFGVSFSFSWQGAALASAVVAFPLLVRAIRTSFEAIDIGLEQAARTLGASRIRVFFTLSLPLAFPGILAGIILSFARSLGEFGATITFVSNIPNQTQTIPLAMYSLIETPGAQDAAWRLCLIAIGLSFIALLVSEWLLRLSKARLGRG